MTIFSKSDISNISRASRSLVDDIENFSSDLEGVLETHNEELENKLEEYENMKSNTISKINSNSYFSSHVKNRLIKFIETVDYELEQENFEMDVNIDENDISENFSARAEDFLENHLNIEDHIRYVNSVIDEAEDRILKVNNFADYVKPKHKFIIEKKNGFICIKDKYHADYLDNKILDISIDNSDILFVKQCHYDSNSGWFVTPEILDEFKKIKTKLNNMF